MVDFHTHILPGVDDGSACVDESLELLAMEAQQEIRQVVLTPHFYPRHDSPDRFLARRQAAFERLTDAMAQSAMAMDVRLGAEVYYFSGMSRSDVLPQLAIQGTGYVLVEMPMGKWTDSMYDELEAISRYQGLTPIIAHIDRYIDLFNWRSVSDRLAQMPVLVQCNAGMFLKRSRGALALRMLRQGRIHLLGSDCHNLDTRLPNMGNAVSVIRHKLGEEAVEWIRKNQQNVLRG